MNDYDVPYEMITILSQYKAQCREIERELKDILGFTNLHVNTVVASQGKHNIELYYIL